MSIDQLLAFNVVLLAAILSPSAAFLLAARTSVASGWRAGILTGLGLGLMASLWTLAALLGLDAVFALFPWACGTLKTGGALYLMYLACKTWRTAKVRLSSDAKPARRAFLDGVLVNLGNPKAMLFGAAVIVVVFPQTLPAMDIAPIMLNHLALEIPFYTTCAMVLSAQTARLRYLKAKQILDQTAALLLGGLGPKLLLQR